MFCHIQSINIVIVSLGIDDESFDRYFDLFKSYSCIPIQDISNTIDINKKIFVNFIPLFQDRDLKISEYVPQTGNFAIIGLADKDHNHHIDKHVQLFFDLSKEKHPNALPKCLLFNSESDEIASVVSVPKVGNVNFYVYQLLCDTLAKILKKIDEKIRLIESSAYPPTPSVLKAFEETNLSPVSSPTLKDLFSNQTDEARLMQLKSSGRTFKLIGDYLMLKGEYQDSISKLKSATDLLRGVDPIWYGGALWSLCISELLIKTVNMIEPTTFRESRSKLDKDESFEILNHVKDYILKLNTQVLPIFEQQQCNLLCAEVSFQIVSLNMEYYTGTFLNRLECDNLIIKTNYYLYNLDELTKARYYIRLSSFYDILKYPRRKSQFTYYSIKAMKALKPVFNLKSITPMIVSSLETLGFRPKVVYCCGWLYLMIDFITQSLLLSERHDLHETRAYLAYIALSRLYHYMNKDDQKILMQHFRAGKELDDTVNPLIISMKIIKPQNEFDIHTKEIEDISESRRVSKTDPFIYNPFDQRKTSLTDKLESSVDDVVTAEIALCNPFMHPLSLANLKLDVDGKAECQPKNIDINAKTINLLHLRLIPKDPGMITINGCRVNCPELGLTDRLIIRPIVLSHSPPKIKRFGLLEAERIFKDVVYPIAPKDIVINVVPSVPFLKLPFGALSQRIMLFNGEKYKYVIPVLNSSTVKVNHIGIINTEAFNESVRTLDLEKLCYFDFFHRNNPSLIDCVDSVKEISPQATENMVIQILGKPFW
eukprot:NODE_14_length_51535_cov_1.125049.p2 type:complete len:767 gc:universal NODE_14_length_51535_cov_1.125049:11351-9051(-)